MSTAAVLHLKYGSGQKESGKWEGTSIWPSFLKSAQALREMGKKEAYGDNEEVGGGSGGSGRER